MYNNHKLISTCTFYDYLRNHGLGPHSIINPPSVLSSVAIPHHRHHHHLHPDHHHHHRERTSRRLDTMSISVNLPSSQLIMKHWLAKPHFIIIAVVIIAIVIVSIIIIVGVKVITNVLIFLLKVIDLIYIYIH